MSWSHLSKWDQEEYVLGQRTPAMVRHLTQCSACQAGVASLTEGIEIFRTSAMQWSADCAETGTQRVVRPVAVRAGLHAVRWALAVAMLLLVAFPLYYLATRNLKPQQHVVARTVEAPPISDDALLQQVDDEVSVAVPSSMEPLTHLVATRNGNAASSTGGLAHVQSN